MDTFSDQTQWQEVTNSKPASSETTSNGLRYRIEGTGAAEVVLIHELGGGLASWDGVAAELERSVRLVRYDQRGQGKSQVTQSAFTVADQAEDLRALLHDIGFAKPVWLVAAAAGASIAVAFATKCAARVKGIVFCGPALDVDPARRGYLIERAQLARQQGMEAIVEMTLANSWPSALRQDADVFNAYRRRFVGQNAEGYAFASEALSGIELSAALEALACPCLFLAGEQDLQRPPQRVATHARSARNASFAVVPLAGHLMAVQRPRDVAARIASFIAENDR
ncbi:alpha/beta fold hydrolase [Paraburkholderia graminis]|uniref:alpha/beta fold hydrolase n=1 Tax=Paraburkholderia graminis TaxID=60548 RepID=UPI0038B834CD